MRQVEGSEPEDPARPEDTSDEKEVEMPLASVGTVYRRYSQRGGEEAKTLEAEILEQKELPEQCRPICTLIPGGKGRPLGERQAIRERASTNFTSREQGATANETPSMPQEAK